MRIEQCGKEEGRTPIPPRGGTFVKLGHLEGVKVVTESPEVNLRRDHYTIRKRAGIPPVVRCFVVCAIGASLAETDEGDRENQGAVRVEVIKSEFVAEGTGRHMDTMPGAKGESAVKERVVEWRA